MENRRGREKDKKTKGKWSYVLLWVLIITVCAVVVAFFALNAFNDIFGMGKEEGVVELTVESGMSVRDVASLLKEKEVINQSSTFVLYSRIRNKEGVIQAGDYVLNKNMSYDDIILLMKKGNFVREEIKLTFYEGMTALDIAKLLDENKVCSKDDFLEAVDTESFGYEFEDMLPQNDLRFRKLEGYLFPDTYDFFIGENPYSVLKKFIKNFNDKVYEPLYDEIRNAGLTLDEAVTLASVIQKEASVKEEMYKVSSVFHNRLEDESAGLPMLQSDVTKHYVEDDIKPFHTMQNQEMYDAYNTYVCKGLPVGPICSPGVEAIKAAVYPEETNYYYFVTDANAKYYYSTTFPEHERNVAIAGSVKKN